MADPFPLKTVNYTEMSAEQWALISELISWGCCPKLTYQGFLLSGFYNSSSIVLVPSKNKPGDAPFLAVADQAGRHWPVYNVESLAKENYRVWQQCRKNSGDFFDQPNDSWVPLLLRFGLIEKVTRYEERV